MGYV